MHRRLACAVFLLVVPAASSRTFAQIVARKARIGFVIEPPIDDAIQRSLIGSLRQGLRELGQIEGQHYVLELRSANGNRDALPEVIDEILKLPLDVLVAAFPATARVVRRATTSVPVVAVAVDNPVETGLAETMPRPGGNITGISSWGTELVAKRLQLLRDLLPTAKLVGVVAGREGATQSLLDAGMLEWGRALGLQVRVYEARDLKESEAAWKAMVRDGIAGVIVLADTNTYTNRARLNALCLKHRLPSVWGGRDFLTGGALASYQSDFPAIFKRAATLVDAILKGAKPGEIPFEQATKLELVIDMRAARALGIVVPNALLLAADQVIE
jgi:putative ABC transport system substrate-binding protein